MSVGAGSIKRAVKAANSTEETKQEAGGAVDAAISEAKAESKSEDAKAAQKSKAQKNATKKAAGKKAAGKKSAAPKASKDKKADKAVWHTPYEAYGVGQELPVHLM